MFDQWKYNEIRITNPNVKFGHVPNSPSVHVDIANGKAGTVYPLGTLIHPVNNMADANAIVLNRGITNIQVVTVPDDLKETIKEQWKRISGNIIEL